MTTARPDGLAPRNFHWSFFLHFHDTGVGRANLALIRLFLLHDARVGGADRAVGLSHLLEVPDGLAEGLDDARPRIWDLFRLHFLLHCTWVGCAYLVRINSDWDWLKNMNGQMQFQKRPQHTPDNPSFSLFLAFVQISYLGKGASSQNI